MLRVDYYSGEKTEPSMSSITIGKMISEIREIPDFAEKLALSDAAFSLPTNVPYIGMGSSYFAALAIQLAGFPVAAFAASEFYHIHNGKTLDLGVLISQSGRSSEVLWCRKLFTRYLAVTNEAQSPLAANVHCLRAFNLHAGLEECSSSKTYVNTLLLLLRGLGYDILPEVNYLRESIHNAEEAGREMADFVFESYRKGLIKGIIILGAGNSVASALQASLVCSETTRLVFIGMPLAWYDHGFKETAENTVVIFIKPDSGSDIKRAEFLSKVIGKAGGYPYFTRGIPGELFRPVHEIVPLLFFAAYFAGYLGIKDLFTLGGKVTETDQL